VTLTDRLSKICKDKKIKNRDLVKLGLGSRQTVSAILNGIQKPSLQFLEIFLKAFTDVDARWLFTGTEEFITEEPKVHYGICLECIAKAAKIEQLEKLLTEKDKQIIELSKGAESQTDPKKEAS